MLEAFLMQTKKSSGGGTVTGRFFRMYIIARNQSAAITIGEWELYDNNGINQARGKPSTASNAEFGNSSGAFDGIIPVNLTQPRWQTNAPANPQWISVDMGVPTGISSTALYCDTSQIPNYADYSPRDWWFQSSLDGIQWNDIMFISGQTPAVWSSKRKHEWVF